ncbi:unnamed protein product [Moneuplotes crassus]|uniref:Amino acid transporter transmembrane domain-containing protein n=1 Tax=Euplotes crassus TaxID=5936 RepID=A0AAD1U7I8_EUPCR|nr:unnamed protein product [Moneuplotes crassus]
MHHQCTQGLDDPDWFQDRKENDKELGEELIKNKTPKMGTIQTFFTLLKGFLGAGMLFLPNGYSNAGWLFGTGGIIISMLITMTCGLLLIQVASKYPGTFSELGFLAMGNKGRYICDLVLALSQASFVTFYIAFISQSLNNIFENHWGFTINIWIIGVILFFIYTPLCWYRKIQSLKRFHILADITVFLAVGVLTEVGVTFYLSQGSFADDTRLFNPDKYLIFVGTAIFMFEGVGIVLPVREACRNKDQFPAIFVTMILFLTCMLISYSMFQYMVYGDQLLSTAPMITKLLTHKGIVVEIVMLMFIMSFIFSYPLVIYPSHLIIESYIIDKKTSSSSQVWIRNLSRALVVFATLFIGIYFEDTLDRLLSIIGTLTCTPVAFIMPAVFHLQLVADTRFTKAIDYSIILLGMTLLIGLTSYTIISWQ